MNNFLKKFKKSGVKKSKALLLNSYFSHILIAIVALIECLILIVFTTFSWIESSSSLIIKGENMQVTDTLNYQLKYATDGDTVDLSTFFSPVENFKFSKTSSPDGKTFYYPRTAGKYRKGDTTDNNTSIRTVDFVFNNENGSNDLYYLFNYSESAPVFSFPDFKGTELQEKASKIFRCSIQEGENAPKIYAMPGTPSHSAIKDLNGSPTLVSPKSFDSEATAFSINQGTTKKIRISVYLESTALSLTDAEWEAILASRVNINISFKIQTTKPVVTPGKTYFVDYSGEFSTSSSIRYFYNGSNSINLTYDDSYLGTGHRWVAQNIDFDINPVSSHTNNTYFDQSGKTKYYLLVDPSDPSADNTFSAIGSVSKSSTEEKFGCGTWQDVVPVSFKADDYTYYTASPYNEQTSSSASLNTSYPIFARNTNNQTIDYSSNITKLSYNSSNARWEGFVPSTYMSSPLYFQYTSSEFYSSNNFVTFASSRPYTNSHDEYVFSLLGFSDTGNTEGVGTWSGIDDSKIKLDYSLLDFDAQSSDRYQVGILLDGERRYYYMAPTSDNNFISQANIPTDAGKSDSDTLSFKRISASGVSGSGATAQRGSKDTCHMVYNRAGENIENYWNLVVAVDGTAEHLVKKSFDEFDENPLLAYSLDGGTTLYDMTRMDAYRWYAPLDSYNNYDNLDIVWCPYNVDGKQNLVRFDYRNGTDFNLSDGIFVTIVESSESE